MLVLAVVVGVLVADVVLAFYLGVAAVVAAVVVVVQGCRRVVTVAGLLAMLMFDLVVRVQR